VTVRTTGKRPAVALVLGGLVVLLAAARIPLLVVDEQNSLASTVQALAIAVPFAAIGVLVARRRPGNAIGWLIVTPALCFLLGTDAGLYAAIRYRLGYGLPAGPVALPAGIGVGILKYRLYDIDRVISRTLAYGIVTGLLVGM